MRSPLAFTLLTFAITGPVLCMRAEGLRSTGAAGIPATSWAEVVSTKGELSFWRAMTSYAVTCDADDFPRALGQVATWPQKRAQVAERVLLQSWVERVPEQAIAYQAAHKNALKWDAQEGFYRSLALVNTRRALELVVMETPETKREAYELALLDAIVEIDPSRALEIASGPGIRSKSAVPRTLNIWADHDPKAAWEATMRVKDAGVRSEVRQMVFHTFFQADPAAALASIEATMPAGKERTELIRNAASGLGMQNLRKLQQVVEAAADPEVRALLSEGLDASLAWGSSDEIWAFKREAKSWAGLSSFVATQLAAYALSQPEAEAKAFFESTPVTLFKDSYEARRFAQKWTVIDEKAALAWAAKVPETEAREGALLGINQMLLEIDPALAVAQIELTPSGRLREELVNSTVRAYGTKNLPEALDWVVTLPAGSERDRALTSLAGIGAANDPQAVLSRLKDLPEGPVRTRFYEVFGKEWVRLDAPAATEWFFSLKDGSDRTVLRDLMLGALVERAPEAALQRAALMENSTERFALVGSLAEKAAAERPEEVLAVIQALPEGTQRSRFLRKALEKLTEENPQKAAEIVSRDPLGRKEQGGMINNVALDWSYRDPMAAARWLDSLGMNPHSGKIFEIERSNVASLWVEVDPDAAIAWVSRMPESEQRGWALTHVANHLSSLAPTQSFDLMVTARATERDLRRQADALFAALPEKAESYIRRSGLPEEMKAKLIEGRAR